MKRDFKLHDKVRILATNEIAYIVWYDIKNGHDTFLLELRDKCEMPEFYERKDFELIQE